MYVIAFVLHLLDVWFRGLDGLYVFSVLDFVVVVWPLLLGAIQNDIAKPFVDVWDFFGVLVLVCD